MDSMRSLNTSLPSARRRPQPPAQLLQAFKTAALQVTNLYKAAATDREQAHEEGYQAALEDMLSFLDNENLGVQDGEGWRVRQWVTEKLQEGMGNHIDSDDENATTGNNNNNHHHNTTHHDDDKAARSSSSPVRRSTTEEPAVAVSAPPPVPSSLSPEPAAQIATPTAPETRPAFDPTTLPKGDFTFRANQSLPAQQADLDMDPEPENEGGDATTPMQINVFPRHHGRSTHHHNHHRGSNNASTRTNHARDSSRNNATTAAAVAQINNLGQGAGLKRRAPFGDFFDITGVGNGKDMFGGGGKRGRFT